MTRRDAHLSTVLRGLIEAALLIAVGALVASAAAGVWMVLDSGEFPFRLGVCMVVAGLLASAGSGVLTRGDMVRWSAVTGAPVERVAPFGGGRVLTGGGVTLLVGVPLFVGGALLLG